MAPGQKTYSVDKTRKSFCSGNQGLFPPSWTCLVSQRFHSVVLPQLFQSGSPVWKGPGSHSFWRGAPHCTTQAAEHRAGRGGYGESCMTVAPSVQNRLPRSRITNSDLARPISASGACDTTQIRQLAHYKRCGVRCTVWGRSLGRAKRFTSGTTERQLRMQRRGYKPQNRPLIERHV
jgi:hypothetical protein